MSSAARGGVYDGREDETICCGASIKTMEQLCHNGVLFEKGKSSHNAVCCHPDGDNCQTYDETDAVSLGLIILDYFCSISCGHINAFFHDTSSHAVMKPKRIQCQTLKKGENINDNFLNTLLI